MYKAYKGHKTCKVAKIIETQKKANVNIEGVVTYKQGILSGFNRFAEVTIPSEFSVSSGDAWEIIIKFKTASDFSSDQYMFSGSKENGANSITVRVTSSGRIAIRLRGSDGFIEPGKSSSLTLNVLTNYYLRILFDGSQYTFDISTDNQEWTNYITVTSSLLIYDSIICKFGGYTNANDFWMGSIDLNESYININGERWWNGTTDEDVFYTSYKIIQEINNGNKSTT